LCTPLNLVALIDGTRSTSDPSAAAVAASPSSEIVIGPNHLSHSAELALAFRCAAWMAAASCAADSPQHQYVALCEV